MLICVWVLAQVSCYSANFNFTYKMQIGRIKNIPFIYKMIIEIVMAAAETVLKASDVLILELLMWRPVRPQKYNNKLCCCYFCKCLVGFWVCFLGLFVFFFLTFNGITSHYKGNRYNRQCVINAVINFFPIFSLMIDFGAEM